MGLRSATTTTLQRASRRRRRCGLPKMEVHGTKGGLTIRPRGGVLRRARRADGKFTACPKNLKHMRRRVSCRQLDGGVGHGDRAGGVGECEKEKVGSRRGVTRRRSETSSDDIGSVRRSRKQAGLSNRPLERRKVLFALHCPTVRQSLLRIGIADAQDA